VIRRDIPYTFLIGENDQSALNAAAAEAMIEGPRKMELGAFGVVERGNGGHYLMISWPEWTAGAIRRAAGEGV
jgi:hypothetical protein